MTIRGIHDIAGARLVLVGGRFKQDHMVVRIVDAFARGAKPPLVLDRRARPSFGYRAVHVIPFIDKLPVEIQVRTDLQHRWAEIMERLGDRWGRGMRYGLGPDDPDKPIFSSGSSSTTRADFTDDMMRWSEMIDRFEQLGLEIAALHNNSGQATPEVRALYDESCTMEDGLREKLTGLLGSAQREGEAS